MILQFFDNHHGDFSWREVKIWTWEAKVFGTRAHFGRLFFSAENTSYKYSKQCRIKHILHQNSLDS